MIKPKIFSVDQKNVVLIDIKLFPFFIWVDLKPHPSLSFLNPFCKFIIESVGLRTILREDFGVVPPTTRD
jgi:hypothetical protein